MNVPPAALRVASWLMRAAPPLLRAIRARRAATDVEARQAALRREVRERLERQSRWPL
jgi:hypothetical protein